MSTVKAKSKPKKVNKPRAKATKGLKPKMIITDEYAELRLNSKIYSKETIFAVGYVLLDKLYILLDMDKNDIIVYLYPQHKKTDLQKLCLEFCNELLNYAHYFTRAQNNAEAVKTIMQRALFSAAPSLIQEAEEREIEDLIRELEEEEEHEKGRKDNDAAAKTGK